MRKVTFLAIVLMSGAGFAHAQTSYPMLSRIQPTAIQVGQTAEVTIGGTQNFAGATRLLFEGEGLSGEIVDAGAAGKPAAEIKARITVAGDARPGPRELRVVTPRGVSSVGLVVLVNEPVTTEADEKANDTAAGAPSVDLPTVLTGTIVKDEDVDWYAFEAQAGQRLSFGVWANRLQNKIHDLQAHFDPILILHDAEGRELAADDNRQLADPLLTYEVPATGTYRLEVRDTTYAGNPNWTYVLRATTGPTVTSVFPMAVPIGTRSEVEPSGFHVATGQAVAVEVPAGLQPGPFLQALGLKEGLSQPVPLVATDLPVEREPGDAPAEPGMAPSLPVPSALCGRLAESNDVDTYRLEAKKGQAFVFEVVARRAGASADPVLAVLDAAGKTLTEVDDTRGKDPRLAWTAPSDGTFGLQLRDLHSRGGPEFGYVLQVRPAEPDFSLRCDPDKVNVGPGARTTVFVLAEREGGFDGPITVEWERLPPGVSASPLVIPPQMKQGEMVLSAASDAALGAGLARIVGRAEVDGRSLVRAAQPRQEIYLPGGGRGLYDVATLPVCVTEPSDITVEASPGEITLRPGETAAIEVTVTRREGFAQPVNLAVNLVHLGQTFASGLPPGVVIKEQGSKTLLDPKTSKGTIVLEAKPDAVAIEKVPIAVMGHVSINFVVKTAFASAPILVTVAPKGAK